MRRRNGKAPGAGWTCGSCGARWAHWVQRCTCWLAADRLLGAHQDDSAGRELTAETLRNAYEQLQALDGAAMPAGRLP